MVELGDHFCFRSVIVGLFAQKLNVQEGEFGKGKVALFTIANIAAHAIGWIVVALYWIFSSMQNLLIKYSHRVLLQPSPIRSQQ